ncbi:DnaA regulatory inactivator Hda [Litoribrevibacter albus]|uniref:DnaA regulatory inactivator Hda n=1 Tax=Litoribrevibacter albus TaxID=1473156 RepID=A0AA37SCZ5_9GAMM|nr:DnaA regulatory inactivator Hda [Litoribrevibacter albus]GLQ32178.1 DnaA regulatory inactivator Hda [Litoribrevibacter albus]
MAISQLVQLPLDVQLKPEANFDSFWAGENSAVVDALLRLSESIVLQNPIETNFYLWGAEGVGKTHLLQALCNQVGSKGIDCVYLPLPELLKYGPEVMQGIENMKLVCLDDVQCLIGNKQWQIGIFHLFNRLRDRGHCLVVSSDESALQIPLELADLKSRFSWGLTFKLESLSELDARNLLIDHANKRGLEMSEEVADYIVTRARRSAPELLTTLEQLDLASLSAKRKLTRPFVKDVLDW